MTRRGSRRELHNGAIFAIPVAIGVATVIGLVGALTGDGLRDVLSWLTLSVPAVATIWAMYSRRR